MKSFLRSNLQLIAVASLCLVVGMAAPAAAAKVVKFAKKAGYAKTSGYAAKAGTATTATSAGDSAKLGGVAASAFPRSPQVVTGTDTVIASNGGYGSASVSCPGDTHVLGGGFDQSDGIPSVDIFRTSITAGGRTYTADGKNVSGTTNRRFWVYAVCG